MFNFSSFKICTRVQCNILHLSLKSSYSREFVFHFCPNVLLCTCSKFIVISIDVLPAQVQFPVILMSLKAEIGWSPSSKTEMKYIDIDSSQLVHLKLFMQNSVCHISQILLLQLIAVISIC